MSRDSLIAMLVGAFLVAAGGVLLLYGGLFYDSTSASVGVLLLVFAAVSFFYAIAGFLGDWRKTKSAP